MTVTVHDEGVLRRWLVDYLITTVGCDPDDIDADRSLNDLGVGSRDAVVLSGELAELVGRPVSPVDFWEHPTIDALVGFLTAPESEPAPAAVVPAGRRRVDEPIAVIGVGCRFPGEISGPEELWRFLCEGRSAVTQVPADRWSPFDDGSPEVAAALAGTTRWGSFLSDVDAFDAEFFEISPREAAMMDPQQRLLLEVAWEALEHAGIPAGSLRRSQTGVFAGACLSEYGYFAATDLGRVDAWSNTGGALSIIANRLSYFLDLRGPSVAVDTACSSSLVAVHLACQSLRMGDSELAIAAGVNLLLSPAIFRSFDQASALSSTGQCHAFDAVADGFVRGEGCGVVILRRLTDALRDGDRVLAVVRGSAVNQDGRSNGLMAPNPAAQMAVLRAAYDAAGVSRGEVDYVEAHGTGTLLGDPIEARALGAVLGRGRPDDAPLLIGAIKSNLGHLEAAAGIAGFLKTVLAIQRGHIPANLGFHAPNPHIAFQDLRLKVVAEHRHWPSTPRPRRAGVSSFGFGGTNAHVVLEQAPEFTTITTPAQPPVHTLVITGKTPERIASTAAVLADWMTSTGADVSLADLAHTLNHHRTHHPRFATVTATGRDHAITGLRALASGGSAPGVVTPHHGPCGPGTVFVYSGQGSQWTGMARQLLDDEPAFAAAITELEPVFYDQVGFSLHQTLTGTTLVTGIERARAASGRAAARMAARATARAGRGAELAGIERIQPVLVGLQLALTQLWRSYGVEPDAVIGHSMGEVTAAVVAGALSVADGLKVIATRSKLMSRLSGQGAMALLELDAQAATALIADYPAVTLAVHASPRQSVIAGPPQVIDVICATVQQRDRLARRIDVDVASHHPTVDPILPELHAALADLAAKTPSIPIITTTHDNTNTLTFDADHWVANLRNPVRFAQAVATAGRDHTTFIEISPHPLLTHGIDDILADTHHHSIGTLQRDTHDTVTFHTNLNSTHTTHPPQSPHPPEPHPVLPTTPWHHTHHWIETHAPANAALSAPRAGTLLGEHLTVSSTPPHHLWQARLLPAAKPYPGHHRLHGVEVVPVSVLLHTMLTAAAELGTAELSAIRFENPVIVDRTRTIQVVADHESISLASNSGVNAPNRWIKHVTARLSQAGSGSQAAPTADANNHLDTDNHYDTHNHRTVNYATDSMAEVLRTWGIDGQPFPWSIDSCTATATSMTADVKMADASTVALLDAAAHLAPLVGATEPRLYVASGVDEVRIEQALTDSPGSVAIRRTGGGETDVVVDVTLAAADGSTCVSLRSLRYVALDPGDAQLRSADGDPTRFVHSIEWLPRKDRGEADIAEGEPHTVAVLGAGADDDVRRRLDDAGYPSTTLAGARHVLYVADGGHTEAIPTDTEYAARILSEVTGLVRRLSEQDTSRARLWIVTRGVREAADARALRQSPLWGLAGVVAAEHPEIWGGLVDIASKDAVADAAAALATVLERPSKSILALRDGVFLEPALMPVTGAPVRGALRCRADAAYLITGGLGALGLRMAAWLADLGARRILLAGRTPLPPRRDWGFAITDSEVHQRIAAIRQLEVRGVSAEVVPLDIGSGADLRALLDRRDAAGAPPIRGVIHAAGVTHDQLLTDMTEAAMTQVMWPKISGAGALHDAFPPGSVDFFFLTSSAAALFGVQGQGSYAAANAYLDALARARHRQGCHTVSLDWVAWRDLGFAADAAMVVRELERMGSRALEPEEAFLAWDRVQRYDLAQAVVVPVQSDGGAERADVSDASAPRNPAHVWSQMSATELQNELACGLRTIVALELGMPESELDTERPFAELGLNSLTALSIRRKTEQLVGIELSATMLWNHPTIALLAVHLVKKLSPQEESGGGEEQLLSESASSVLDSLFDSIESSPASTVNKVR